MPAKSKAMQQAAGIALHSPEKLYARNKGMLKMSKADLHKYAATKRKGLPAHKGASPDLRSSAADVRKYVRGRGKKAGAA